MAICQGRAWSRPERGGSLWEIDVTPENLEGLISSRQSIFALANEKPAGLPVRQIASSELVINPGVARSLGLQNPAAFRACADEVIE
jgi:hypothetical protein